MTKTRRISPRHGMLWALPGSASARGRLSVGCKAPRSPRRACLCLSALVAICMVAAYAIAATLMRSAAAPGERNWTTLSAEALVKDMEDNPAYLKAAGWQRGQGGGYEPIKLKDVKRRGVAGHTHVFSWHANSHTTCGPAETTTVLHMEAMIEDVDPKFAQEVLMSPAYGLDWNPGIKDVLLRKDRYGEAGQNIPDTFYPGDGRSPPPEADVTKDSSAFHLLGQVTEIPLPGPVELTYGRHFTADWAAHRFECTTNRGYTVATSSNTSQLAIEAGVTTEQDLCHSGVLIAPWTASEGHNGTIVHFISHVDPHAPARAILPFVLKGTQVTLTAMLKSVGRKAREIQRRGAHPVVRC